MSAVMSQVTFYRNCLEYHSSTMATNINIGEPHRKYDPI